MYAHACTLPFGKAIVNVGVFVVDSSVNIALLDESGNTVVLSADGFTVDDGDGYELVGVGVEGHKVG